MVFDLRAISDFMTRPGLSEKGTLLPTSNGAPFGAFWGFRRNFVAYRLPWGASPNLPTRLSGPSAVEGFQPTALGLHL